MKFLQAFNGKEGLKIASKQVPSIIISDVMMPKMDGIEMVTEIKKKSNHQSYSDYFINCKNFHRAQNLRFGSRSRCLYSETF